MQPNLQIRGHEKTACAHADTFDCYISIFNFLRVDLNDPSFRRRASSGLIISYATKYKKATTNGDVKGSQLEREDHLVAANNKLLMPLAMASDSKFSSVYDMMDNLIQTYEDATCCLWVDRHWQQVASS